MANSKITKDTIVNGWSYPLNLTSDKPFTAQRDMFVSIEFNPSTISGGAALVKIDDDCRIGLNAVTGTQATQCVPLKAGETISVVSVSNGSLSIQYSYMWGGYISSVFRDLLSGGLHDKQDKAGHIRQYWNICIKHWKEYNPVSIQKPCKLSYAVRGRSFFNMHNKCDNSQCRDIIEWQTRPYSNSKWRLQLYTRWSFLVGIPLHLWTRTVNTALERGCAA